MKASAAKPMWVAEDQSLDDSVYKWFYQLHLSRLVVQETEIQTTAERLF